jgi:hypothetical protein
MDALDTQRAVEDSNEDLVQAHPVSALALIETVTAVQVFAENGLDPILERIEKEARSMALDISTPKGRKEIASLAHKIAKSKTGLDKMGKELVAGWKEKAKKVDQERARAWDRLEALQEEIRRPLTEWENRDKDRIAKLEADVAEVTQSGVYTAANWQTLPLEAMNDRLKEILSDRTDWQEFSAKARQAIEAATDAIAAAIIKRQKHDADQAELARLRKEEEERKQREHEARIANEAAEKARLAAEAIAKREAEAEALRVKAEQEKAEKERQRIQREKEEAEAKAKRDAEAAAAREAQAKRETAEAEARAAQAEKARIAAGEKAKEDARIAAERAAADKKTAEEAAAKRERDRIEAEKRTEAEATAKREADKAHRAKINREAMQRLMGVVSPHSIVDPAATAALVKAVVEAIARGEVPHIKISY